MKVAVSITKVFDMDTPETCDMDALELLRYRLGVLEEGEEGHIGWYDLEPEQEIWSYAIVEEGR